MIELFHSADAKPEVGDHFLFGTFVFFSSYVQHARGSKAFAIQMDEDEIIDVETVLSHEVDGNMRHLVEAAQALILGQHGIAIDEKTAEGLVEQCVPYDMYLSDAGIDSDEFDSYDDYKSAREYARDQFEFDAETAWNIQMLGVRAAKIAGFRGVWLDDEMGRSAAICMEGRDAEFKLHEGLDA